MRPIIDGDGDVITSAAALENEALADSGDNTASWLASRVERGTFTRDSANQVWSRMAPGHLWEDLAQCEIPAPVHVIISRSEQQALADIGHHLYDNGQTVHVLGRPSITRMLTRITDWLADANAHLTALEGSDRDWRDYRNRRTRLHSLAGKLTAARYLADTERNHP